MNTTNDGSFSFEGLKPGRYRIVTGKLDEYIEAKFNGKFVRIEIPKDAVEAMVVEISLQKAGL